MLRKKTNKKLKTFLQLPWNIPLTNFHYLQQTKTCGPTQPMRASRRPVQAHCWAAAVVSGAAAAA
jgi:hypothetical protein